MEINGNVELISDGSAEIRNAFIERVTTVQEQALQASSGLVHVGRLIYNRSEGKLKAWTGSRFETFLTVSDDASAQRLDLLIQALGGLVTIEGTFDVTSLADFNLSYSLATNLLEVLRVIDGAIQNLQSREFALNELTDVTVSAPVFGQVLKYDGNGWVASTLDVEDVNGITVTADELNALTGVTETIQPVLDELKARIELDMRNDAVGLEQVAQGAVTVVKQGNTVQMSGTLTVTYDQLAPFVVGNIDPDYAPLTRGIRHVAAWTQTDWVGGVNIELDGSTILLAGVPRDLLIEDNEILTFDLSSISYFTA